MVGNFASSATCNDDLMGPSLTDVCKAPSFFIFMSLLNALIQNNEVISGKCQRVKPVAYPDDKYDYVIVGGGAAGSVIAARLSEISNNTVLLLEAGPDEPSAAQFPASVGIFLGITDIVWNYTTSNERNACLATNGSCAWPSGKNLGGNTVHNGMVYKRGHPKDYDDWFELGNEGWSWEEVKPFFLKAEDNGEIESVGREYHATGGPLPVERFPYIPPFAYSILKAADEKGFPITEDANGEKKTGFSQVQLMQKKGVRYSSSRSYLWPARNRKNLHISLNSTVTRVIIENKKAVGVEYVKDGEKNIINASREVILSAGVVESPHILMLSGIGPKKHLESVGVDLVLDLPGVGENLHDHPCVVIPLTMNDTDTYENNWIEAFRYLVNQTGPLSGIGTTPIIGMLESNATTPNRPDIEIYTGSNLVNCAPGEVGALQSPGRRVVLLAPSYLYPKSRGRITLKSKNPLELPSITVNYLEKSEDVDRMIDGINLYLSLLDTKIFRDLDVTLSNISHPACTVHTFKSNEYWACVIRQNNYALYHQGGTCKMGPSNDSMAVVDPRLRVYGIKGLRVADTSIMPVVPAANTAAPAIMIGERAADFIKKDSGQICS